MTKSLVVFVTASSRKEADKIAQALVAEKLAACVTIVPEVFSRYRWKGHVENSEELLLIIKTFSRLYKALEKRVKALHSYSVPEILAVPVMAGNADYLKWMKDSLE
jgi:periplasmic divalent cation tolerance protein